MTRIITLALLTVAMILLLVVCFSKPEKISIKPMPELIVFRQPQGDELATITDQAKIHAIFKWANEVINGPDSEHAKNGNCGVPGRMEFYKSATDRTPYETLWLDDGCMHVRDKDVSKEKFDELWKIVNEDIVEAAENVIGNAVNDLSCRISSVARANVYSTINVPILQFEIENVSDHDVRISDDVTGNDWGSIFRIHMSNKATGELHKRSLMYNRQTISFGGHTLKPGQILTMDLSFYEIAEVNNRLIDVGDYDVTVKIHVKHNSGIIVKSFSGLSSNTFSFKVSKAIMNLNEQELDKQIGERITVTGHVQIQKDGIVIVTDRGDFYIVDFDSWLVDKKSRKLKKLEVTGVLMRDQGLPVFIQKKRERPKQGMPRPEGTDLKAAGKRYLLKYLRWKVINENNAQEDKSIVKEKAVASPVWTDEENKMVLREGMLWSDAEKIIAVTGVEKSKPHKYPVTLSPLETKSHYQFGRTVVLFKKPKADEFRLLRILIRRGKGDWFNAEYLDLNCYLEPESVVFSGKSSTLYMFDWDGRSRLPVRERPTGLIVTKEPVPYVATIIEGEIFLVFKNHPEPFGPFVKNNRHGSYIMRESQSIPQDTFLFGGRSITVHNGVWGSYVNSSIQMRSQPVDVRALVGLILTADQKTALEKLNTWDKQELDLAERPDSYPNRKPSGETNAWIVTNKEALKKLGLEVFWHTQLKEYIMAKVPKQK